MGKAIAVAALFVVCSFGFVLLQLMRHVPGGAPAPRGPAPLLQPMDDGSIYSVGLRVDQFEKRLMEEEKRSQRVLAELEAMRKERNDLGTAVDDLQEEVQSLRRQLTERPAAPAPPQSAPAGNNPSPPSRVPGSGPGAPAPAGNRPAAPSPQPGT